MTFDEAVSMTRSQVEGQFPKTCPRCLRSFATLREFLQMTHHIGPPMSYDSELDDWAPREPLGVFSMANCSCRSTLAITSEGMRLWTLWRLMAWSPGETRRRGISMQQLLDEIRSEIDRQVLAG